MSHGIGVRRLSIALWMGLFASFSTNAADVYEFVGGGKTEGPAYVEGEPIRLASPWGLNTFERDDFRRIEPSPWPPSEWPSRREAALSGTSDDRHEAALRALAHGLVDEAAELWREAHRIDPDHVAIARMARMVEALEVERPDPKLEDFTRFAPEGFRVERGPHVILWHRHEPEEIRARVAFLERVVAAFYLEFASRGLELDPPSMRLPSIWFPERSDYLKYLESEGAGAFRSTRGYHHPTRGLVASYDARSDDDQRRGRESIAARRSELEAIRAQIEKARAGARLRLGRLGAGGHSLTRQAAEAEVARLGRDLDRQELLLDLSWQRLDEGNAAHELIHQLVDRSGLAPRYASFPIWLHEGLAMQFEAFEGGRWAGTDSAVEIRLRDYRALRPAPSLAALLRDEGLGSGYRRDPYAQAWAWVYDLRTRRPKAWIGLLDALRRPNPENRPATRRAREALESNLRGTVFDWEQDWGRSIRNLDGSEPPASRRG